MKKYVPTILACVAAIAFCVFLVFLIDLSGFDRIGKMCSIWENTFYEYGRSENRMSVLMANMDILGVFGSLLVFGIPMLELFIRYKYWVMLIPLVGVIMFLFADFLKSPPYRA